MTFNESICLMGKLCVLLKVQDAEDIILVKAWKKLMEEQKNQRVQRLLYLQGILRREINRKRIYFHGNNKFYYVLFFLLLINENDEEKLPR